MTRTELLTKIDELLELPPGTLGGAERLEDLERWNSLAVVGFIGIADECCGLTLSPRLLAGCATVDDLVRLTGTAG